MKSFKQFGIGLLAVLGISLVALPVSGASAKGVLTLTNEGNPVAEGGTADTGLAVEGCVSFAEGKLVKNSQAKDKLTATANATQECFEEGVSETGVITETQLGANGKATLKGKIEITQSAGPCKYKFTKFAGTFEVPGELEISTTSVTGKLNKKGSSASCPKTLETSFVADVTGEPGGERFGDHL
jgi:hypothetical protein